MRRGKPDANQAAIVQALRDAGRDVEIITEVGRGVPDLLVGHNGCNYLLEVKVRPIRLPPNQRAWLTKWRGHKAIVCSPEEAIAATTPGRWTADDWMPK